MLETLPPVQFRRWGISREKAECGTNVSVKGGHWPNMTDTDRAGGGGGKSKDRKSKLRAKNERLNEQRKRRDHEDEKQKKLSKNDTQTRHALGNNGDIHPSRMSRLATEQHVA